MANPVGQLNSSRPRQSTSCKWRPSLHYQSQLMPRSIQVQCSKCGVWVRVWLQAATGFSTNTVSCHTASCHRLQPSQFKPAAPKLPPSLWPATRQPVTIHVDNFGMHLILQARLPPCASCLSDLGPSCRCQHSRSSLRTLTLATELEVTTV